MKKIVFSLLFFLLIIGCQTTNEIDTEQPATNSAIGNRSTTGGDTPEKNVSSEYIVGTPIEKDGIVITITGVKVSDVVGDRTQDNYGKENGEYFANGSDVVKASDYELVEIDVKVENKSDRAITFSQFGWSAEQADGYKFKNIGVTGKLKEQIPSNYTTEEKLSILKEKALATEKLMLNYNLIDYNEEWNKAMGEAVSGTLNEKQWKEKYGDKFNKPIKFELKLNVN